jgi:prepilin-type processing-associated H-X9-DG protein
MYTTDWDGTAPPARVWPEGIDPYLGGNPESRELHVCPSDANTHASEFEGWDLSYTMNEALGQQRIRERPEPGHDVMVFDGNAVSGGQGAADFRHDGSLYVSYADGHVSRVAQEDWTAQWDQPNNTEETR